jgi:hypothetical protein
MKKKILLISRKAERCGVADYGARVNTALQQSELFETHFAEINNGNEMIDWYNKINPDVVLYNYYPVILPFVTDEFVAPIRHIPHITIYHEVGLGFHPTAIIDVDPTKPDQPENGYYTSPRPLFENVPFEDIDANPNKIPTIGSCGFGFADKNFPKIAELVCAQYDEAKIRINMPFATFGDEDGQRAKDEVSKIERIIGNSGKNIKLEVSHDFLEHHDLVRFMRGNDVNVFLYDAHQTRTVSGSMDYALSARKPIAISRSFMFRHINWVTPSIYADETPLAEIIKNGIEPLKPVYEQHTNKALLEKYEYVIMGVLNKIK